MIQSTFIFVLLSFCPASIIGYFYPILLQSGVLDQSIFLISVRLGIILISVDSQNPDGFYSFNLLSIFACYSEPSRFFWLYFQRYSNLKYFWIPDWFGIMFDFNFMIEPLRNGSYSPNLLSFAILFIIPRPVRFLATVLSIILQSIQSYKYFLISEPARNDFDFGCLLES